MEEGLTSNKSPNQIPIEIVSSDEEIESPNQIPTEIVSDEEMALIEAAFAAATPLILAYWGSILRRNSRSIESTSLNCKRRLWDSPKKSDSTSSDIEDVGDLGRTQKKSRVSESLFHRFRRNMALSVSDIIDSEWCQKKLEFRLQYGKRRMTDAMKVERTRHEKLEEEVVGKVKVRFKSSEDTWAAKFVNFIICANQLSANGLTRELPLLGFVKGVWIVGVIDEIQMPVSETTRIPTLMEAKTCSHPTLPGEAKMRNGRLQLMCYKYLWDNVVTDDFPSSQFFNSFGLDPLYVLSNEIQERADSSGFTAKTLEDLVTYFRHTCSTLPPAHDQLLLRYEFQGDNSLIGEDRFEYNSDWLDSQIRCSLDFWLGQREASYVPSYERWKCGWCQYASICPASTTEDHSQLS